MSRSPISSSSAMIRKWLITIAAFGIACSALYGAEKYANPDAPEVHTAAKQALKNAKVLPVSEKVLNIVGVARGISGIVQELGGKITDREVKLELAADVLFDFDKAELRPQAVTTLQKVSQVVKNYPGAPVMIEGHTDSVGSDDYNLKLSERRAQSVKTWLQKEGGIEGTRVCIKGLGETK